MLPLVRKYKIREHRMSLPQLPAIELFFKSHMVSVYEIEPCTKVLNDDVL